MSKEQQTLLRLIARLAKLTLAVQKLTNAICDQQKRDQEDSESKSAPPPLAPILRAELLIPEHVKTSSKTNEDRAHRQQVWLTFGTWLAFAAAAIYAGIANSQLKVMHGQWVSAQKSADAAIAATSAAQASLRVAQENFIRDQRPYVLVESPRREKITLEENKRLYWNAEFINYGRSPAVGMQSAHKVWFGEDSKAKVDNFFSVLPTTNPTVYGSKVILAPNAGRSGTDAPDPYYSTMRSEDLLTRKDILYAALHAGSLIAAGRCWYSDLSGNAYYTDFCRMNLPNGAIAACPEHNEIH